MALRATHPFRVLDAVSKQTAGRATSRRSTTILEVERKFRRLTVPTLTNVHTGAPSFLPNLKQYYTANFQSVLPLPTRTIHDIYYDTPTRTLCSSGAWIRRRNGEWQAKVRKGGDFVNSRFEELRGADEIGDCIREVLGKATGCASTVSEKKKEKEQKEDFGLGKLAEFVTTREGWLVDGEFKVVRDRMDFGHEVGEVELQVEVGGEIDEGEKRGLMEEMDRRIEEFMRRYAWAWERGEAVGKLTAYFEMVARKEKARC